MKQNFTLLCAAILFSGCGPTIKTVITQKEPALNTDEKVAILDLQHSLPENAKMIGIVKFGETGFTTDCKFNSHLRKASKIARKNGANIIKVIDTNKPDLWSSCYRIKVEFYKYNGDVSTINQYLLPPKK